MNKYEIMSDIFGFDSFREGQEEVIDNILGGNDTLTIMPTGGGKSICFQIPALMMPGITIVISPLVSLMKDQVAALVQCGVKAAYLNSSLTPKQYKKALDNFSKGLYKIVYIAPERLKTRDFLDAVSNMLISLICVDEAHCISQWGQDFRPSYLDIASFVKTLGHRPPVAAFTATATDKVRRDIIRLLDLKSPKITLQSFDRRNLFFSVVQPKSKPSELKKYLKSFGGESGIVYCSTRKTVDKLFDRLSSEEFSVTKYHAGLSSEERKTNQALFVNDDKRIMIATNAFGMGIDKSNVNFIIHYNMPGDIESYYQEAGRAGRDLTDASCILFFSKGDIATQRYFIENPELNEKLTEKEKQELHSIRVSKLNDMVRYAQGDQCLRKTILNYFGEKHNGKCGNCSYCLNMSGGIDITAPCLRILSCVMEAERKIDSAILSDILLGIEIKTEKRAGLTRLSAFGSMKDSTLSTINHLICFLLDNKYLKKDPDRSLDITQKGVDVVGGSLKIKSNISFFSKSLIAGVDKKDQVIDNTLFIRLKALRYKLSKINSIPAYMIFSDRTLEYMSIEKPQNPTDFLKIPGVGYQKAQTYGAVFIKEICKHVSLYGE